MSKPEPRMRAYATMMASLTTTIADALAAGVSAESITAALNNLITLLEEE